ncbi:MAG: hypothetical protein ACRC76_10030 [Proteocatella sp.]
MLVAMCELKEVMIESGEVTVTSESLSADTMKNLKELVEGFRRDATERSVENVYNTWMTGYKVYDISGVQPVKYVDDLPPVSA